MHDPPQLALLPPFPALLLHAEHKLFSLQLLAAAGATLKSPLIHAGVEAAGMGVDTDKHAATITKGSPGVLHGSFSLLLQDEEGQVIDPHSISAG